MLGGAGILVHGITFNIATLLFSHTKFPFNCLFAFYFLLGAAPAPAAALVSRLPGRGSGEAVRLSKRVSRFLTNNYFFVVDHGRARCSRVARALPQEANAMRFVFNVVY